MKRFISIVTQVVSRVKLKILAVVCLLITGNLEKTPFAWSITIDNQFMICVCWSLTLANKPVTYEL
jgi:hypothetical protein